jgi:hypothetical protein
VRWLAGPLALAVIITLVNALKPVLIDDTAYLVFARHLAQHPLDPYSFTIHWYTLPDRGMDVLLPPVLPYWLALGMRLFGEHVLLLKLWLFPILWCFTKSLDVLLRRFAPGTERIALPLIALSPAVLATVNLMLDVPALALALAAIALFTRRSALRSEDSASRLTLVVVTGLIAGIAMQTKYTAMLAPAAILWYGLTHRRIGSAILACAVAVAVFAGWEWFLFEKYGESHFLHHVKEQSGGDFFAEKAALIPGLFGHMGCLGFGAALLIARPLGVPRRVITAAAILWMLGLLLVNVMDGHSFPAKYFWRTTGSVVMCAAAAGAGLLVLKKTKLRWSRDSWFVAGWLALELAGYFALTPFPAGRRVIGLAVVFGIVAARAVRLVPARTPPKWVLPFAIWAGVLFTVIDTADAWAEPAVAERAAEVVRGEKRVWFAGHWGFQFYCERAGFTMIVPGETVLQPGDVLVLPDHPDGFGRPHIGLVRLVPPKGRVVRIESIPSRGLKAQTIPNFYGGNDPVDDHMSGSFRLRVIIYRVVKPWSVPGK